MFDKILDYIKKPTDVIPASEVQTVDPPVETPVADPNNEVASAQDAPPAVDAPADYDVASFEEAFPAFRGQKVSADMRARLWKTLAMNPTVTKPIEAEGPSRPIIQELPPIDLKAVTQRMLDAQEAEDTDAVLKAQQEIVNFQGAALESLGDFAVRNEWDNQQLNARISGLEKPHLIRQAGASVQGFQDSDVAVAQKLMDDGVTQDPSFAVRFAVTDRLVKSNSAPPPSAAEDAARTARAAAAASAPSSQTSPPVTGPVNSANFNSPAWRARIAQAVKAKQEQT